jgi:hypothetical protein
MCHCIIHVSFLFTGGNEAVNEYVPYTSILDTTTGVWTEVGELPVGRAQERNLKN